MHTIELLIHSFLSMVPPMLVLAVILNAIALFSGIISMVMDRKFSPEFRNQMMRIRVGLQALVIVLFIIMISFPIPQSFG